MALKKKLNPSDQLINQTINQSIKTCNWLWCIMMLSSVYCQILTDCTTVSFLLFCWCHNIPTLLGVWKQWRICVSLAGSVSILPTILFLVTGVVRECGTEASEGVTSPCVAAALQCLKSLCCSPFTRDPACATSWTTLLRSALATVLDVAKPGMEHGRGERGTRGGKTWMCLLMHLNSDTLGSDYIPTQ